MDDEFEPADWRQSEEVGAGPFMGYIPASDLASSGGGTVFGVEVGPQPYRDRYLVGPKDPDNPYVFTPSPPGDSWMPLAPDQWPAEDNGGIPPVTQPYVWTTPLVDPVGPISTVKGPGNSAIIAQQANDYGISYVSFGQDNSGLPQAWPRMGGF